MKIFKGRGKSDFLGLMGSVGGVRKVRYQFVVK